MKAEPTKTGSLSKTGERQFVAGDSGKTCQRDWQCMPMKQRNAEQG
jgi:hypothetical protein